MGWWGVWWRGPTPWASWAWCWLCWCAGSAVVGFIAISRNWNNHKCFLNLKMFFFRILVLQPKTINRHSSEVSLFSIFWCNTHRAIWTKKIVGFQMCFVFTVQFVIIIWRDKKCRSKPNFICSVKVCLAREDNQIHSTNLLSEEKSTEPQSQDSIFKNFLVRAIVFVFQNI